MATGPLDADPVESLRAERDALVQRCARAEEEVRQLSEELATAHAELAALEASTTESLSLFDGGDSSGGSLTGDGSDPRVLSLILGATAIVAGMVTLLTLVNGNLFSPFGLVMVLVTVALAWGAASTRVVPVEISVVRGLVCIEHGEASYRFDLRKPNTAVEVVGRPGDTGWAVQFLRRGMDPFVVTAAMVDPHDFTAKLREYRPEL